MPANFVVEADQHLDIDTSNHTNRPARRAEPFEVRWDGVVLLAFIVLILILGFLAFLEDHV